MDPVGGDAGTSVPALQARHLAKRFGGQLALAGVDLTIEQGEVLALLGENGSGKSTLVKILSGFHVPEPGGSLRVAGHEVPLPVPHDHYRDYGLSFVYQDLGLGIGLSVVENLFVGRRVGRARGILTPIGWSRERRAAQQVFDRYHVDLDPRATVGDLRPTAQALLAIVRAAEDLRMFRERTTAEAGAEAAHGVLVLDEPTVFLPEDEKVFLFDLVRQVASGGTAVLFVSHDLPAIRELADRAVILRDGAVIGDVTVAETSDERLVELISGHLASATIERAASRAVETVREAATEGVDAAARGPGAGPLLEATGVAGGQLRDAVFTVDAGEIVGIAGLLGSGAEDLPYALFGALAGATGTVRVAGAVHDLARFSPRAARRAGLALVPADRKQQGIAPALTVGENMLSLVLGQYVRWGFLDRRALRRTADERALAFGVRPPDGGALVSSLSGGNQQRVVLARWLEDPPQVLVLHEPTQGVDVGTRAELGGMLRQLAATGIAIIWVSTDFDELADVAQRVLICSDGVIADQITPPITRDRITSAVYAAGARTPGREG